jgi:hypothetical protein
VQLRNRFASNREGEREQQDRNRGNSEAELHLLLILQERIRIGRGIRLPDFLPRIRRRHCGLR